MSDWADIEAELSGLTERGERGYCSCANCQGDPRVRNIPGQCRWEIQRRRQKERDQ